ncbi:unnamed protein product [Rangifer tarandus platyrhynchus]|uniref:Uncharacterized protein n=1 Tax=Rangifer tarandus platyrhynchus TaxID=3082113 RepID=A0ABN8YX54_RANTA|nr:unnamed protein product [Rangifer tarandus platyrhynchus]
MELQSPASFFTRDSPPDFSISNGAHTLADLHPDASSQARRVPAAEGQDPGRGDGHPSALRPRSGPPTLLAAARDNCYLGTELEVLRATRRDDGMEGLVGILGGLQHVSKVTDLREQFVTSYNHEASRQRPVSLLMAGGQLSTEARLLARLGRQDS